MIVYKSSPHHSCAGDLVKARLSARNSGAPIVAATPMGDRQTPATCAPIAKLEQATKEYVLKSPIPVFVSQMSCLNYDWFIIVTREINYSYSSEFES
jgi:hypothetical protein